MDVGELLEAAQELARPCARLVRQGNGPVAGYLRPTLKYQSDNQGRTLFAAIHPQAFKLASIDERRWMLVWTSSDGCECGVEFVPDGMSVLEGGEPLTMVAFVDLPPFDMLARYGDDRVRQWLLKAKWDPSWPMNSNFAEFRTVEAYESKAFAKHPLWHPGEGDIQVGGWPWAWPEDDDHPPQETELLAWTFADAEPWLEVLRYLGAIASKCRIT